jgi:gas vesicle protein
MSRRDAGDDERYVLVEERSTGMGPFLLGAAVGATIALLFAPQSGVETRATIRRRARWAQQAAREAAEIVGERVTDSVADARDAIDRHLESARVSVSKRTRQFSDAVAAGRAAARQAEREMRSELDRTSAGQPVTGPVVRPVSSPSGGQRPVKRDPLRAPRRPPRGGQ